MKHAFLKFVLRLVDFSLAYLYKYACEKHQSSNCEALFNMIEQTSHVSFDDEQRLK